MISKTNDTKAQIEALHPDERYQTPLSLAVKAMELFEVLVPITRNNYFLDIGCGDIPIFGMALDQTRSPSKGLISFAVERRKPDNHQQVSRSYDSVYWKDFRDLQQLQDGPIIYGNPPFSEIRPLLLWAKKNFSIGYIYLLLKIEFMIPKHSGYAKRDDLWQSFIPCHVLPIDRRPGWWCYTPEKGFSRKTNSTDYAFYLWDISQPHSTTTVGPTISWDYNDSIENEVYEWMGLANPYRRKLQDQSPF